MEPKDLRDNVKTVHIFAALVKYWMESSRCSRSDARRDLVQNTQGDYKVTGKDETWEFRNANSGETARYDGTEFVFAGMGDSSTKLG